MINVYFHLSISAPATIPAIVYLRVSTQTNVDNHQNDAALSSFQDEVGGCNNRTEQ